MTVTTGETDYSAPHWASSALVLIDVQNDFVDGATPVAGTAELIGAMVALASAFRAVKRPVVHVVRLYDPGESDVDPVRRAAIEAGAQIVAPGTDGSEIPDSLVSELLDAPLLRSGGVQSLANGDAVIFKPRWSAFYRTMLDQHLRGLGVDTVVVAGCNLPNCPRATLFDASERDYRAVVVVDATSQSTPQRIEDLKLIGVDDVTTAQVTAALLGNPMASAP